LKGKSAIAIARLCGKERNFTGEHLWARGYAVSTVGFELEQVRQYIREQETADGLRRAAELTRLCFPKVTQAICS
jgi:putative transposase